MGEVVVSSGEEEVGMERVWKLKKKEEEEEEEDVNIIEVDKEKDNYNNYYYKVEGSSSSSEVVRWEKFLPRMVLRVLLVEADDSTRHIIAALLRKCSYRVTAVPDGLKAWETLRGVPHNIDLILTEVELPSISGYALLTLVMEHEICKKIPVIMMSSQDSISMVLKCMLKGAADFLIKPIRRNELKNLWQHVWRRQSLNAGRIPESSPAMKQKVEATYENNSASNHSTACTTSSRNNWECHKKVSDSQSSFTTPHLEAESIHMQNMQGLFQLKCVTPSNASIIERQKYEEGDKLADRSITPESISGGRPNELEGKAALCNGADSGTVLRLGEKSASLEAIHGQHPTSEDKRGNTNLRSYHVDGRVEPSYGAIDLTGTFDYCSKNSYGHHYMNNSTNKLEFAPQLELSLNRNYSTSLNSKSQAVDERHALNHSNASAFSWYNKKTLQPSCATSSNNHSDIKEGSAKFPLLSSNQLSETRYGISQQHVTISGDNQETLTTLVIGQSDQGDLAYPSSLTSSASVAGLRLDNCHTSSPRALPPLYYPSPSVAPVWSPKVLSKQEESMFPSGTLKHLNSENWDLKEDCKLLDEATNNSVDQILDEQDNVEPLQEEKHNSPTAGQSSNSSLCNGFANQKSCTPYGSLCSTNDRNSTLAVPAEESITPESSNNGGLFVHDGIRGMDSQRLNQREAALKKFRLKRKDRCFEKKVRYQSRKRLAEQRPRVKGQFVRQAQETTMADANG